MIGTRIAVVVMLAVTLLASATTVSAHSVSNSYMNVAGDAKAANVFHGQWDISLRDLNFLFPLDENGNGEITWGELKKHQHQIADYAYARLHVGDGVHRCRIEPRKQEVDRHAANTYSVLFFDVICPGNAPTMLTIDNQLLFDVDPTHRGIFIFRDRGDADTALFSPKNKKIKLDLPHARGS